MLVRFSFESAKITLIQIGFLFSMLTIISFRARAQVTLPLNREIIQRLEPEIIKQNPYFFTSLKPYDEGLLQKVVNIDSLLAFGKTQKHSTWFGRKLFEESFLQIDSPDFSLRIDPVFNFSLGKENGNPQKLIGNTRGAMVRCRIGQSIGIESSFYENQTFFPKIWDQYISIYRVAPGQGRTKRYNKTGWDYAYSSGSITWHPKGIFMMQLGRDKNFIGDGYRSLLLSDISTNYPFLKFKLSWKKIQYIRITALLQNIDYKIIDKEMKYPQKMANFHLISINTLKHFQLSLFEGTVLKDPDSRGKFTFNFEAADPIPFLNIVGRDQSKDKANSIGGLNLSWHPDSYFQVYNQWIFDDPLHKKNDGKIGIGKYGCQIGFKYFDALKIKNFYFQGELNLVQPFTYSQDDSTKSYSHFDQPLAHPLGANFYEVTGIVNYRYKRVYLEYILTYAKYGADGSTGNSGHNILLTQTHNSDAFLQGIKTNLVTHQARIAWYLNPATNSCISAGIYWQNLTSSVVNRSTKVIYISFSTNLRNLYYDF
ncbi:MAG TPA: hypothetical protein VIH57_22535 [Bacteroidales bacterium]